MPGKERSRYPGKGGKVGRWATEGAGAGDKATDGDTSGGNVAGKSEKVGLRTTGSGVGGRRTWAGKMEEGMVRHTGRALGTRRGCSL